MEDEKGIERGAILRPPALKHNTMNVESKSAPKLSAHLKEENKGAYTRTKGMRWPRPKVDERGNKITSMDEGRKHKENKKRKKNSCGSSFKHTHTQTRLWIPFLFLPPLQVSVLYSKVSRREVSVRPSVRSTVCTGPGLLVMTAHPVCYCLLYSTLLSRVLDRWDSGLYRQEKQRNKVTWLRPVASLLKIWAIVSDDIVIEAQLSINSSVSLLHWRMLAFFYFIPR